MNGRERYEAVLSGEMPDHLPRIPILMRFAAEYIGSDYGRFAADHEVLVEAQLRCAEAFGIDQLSVISDAYREAADFGAEVTFDACGPRCDLAPLERDKDLDRLAHPDPRTSPRMRDRIEAVRRFTALGAGRYSVLGWVEGPAAEAADLRGVCNFMLDFYDDPDYLGSLMDRCLEVGIAFAEAQVEAGADTIGIGDAVASQLGPDLYERHVLPRERRLVDAIRATGARVRLHICGNITHLLPGIATLDLDILDVDHMVDMTAVRASQPPGRVLAGNLDPVAGVLQATPESIRRAFRETWSTVGAPYMVNAGCEIPPGTPAENLTAMCAPIIPGPAGRAGRRSPFHEL